ncbi:lanosterol 14-alpha-demethylase [Salpingoeca rosetta]|uniref:Lanosterol 14-alpha-demethylase n=1 Tax=Salpingoeca rosetta (strain ATCC 50818 / BSB-021) TaxID=946362 RepID=F2UJB0_SALR5|nr:lanosterol 14-alpha-demethylase [Salpingoeca rosetta]EGD77209.1 lanosterol 14-alpha-demethylase [Salpingoeca rosetta]|eukprot:XP_004990553.1 lanosterol 14-alpha-demethylase [Salpingoeca rosetta]
MSVLSSVHAQVHETVGQAGSVVTNAWQSLLGVFPEAVRQHITVTRALAATAVGLAVTSYIKGNYFRGPNAPPKVRSVIPWVGYAVQFGERPIEFLLECKEKYGPVFTFTMFGTDVTYCLGSEASAKFWGSHNDILNAEDLYRNITEPVFGEGIAYAVPHKVFSEQKQMAKEALTKKRFEAYTSIIEKETLDFIKGWGDSGTFDFFEQMAKMIVFTATHCLHGKETRDNFDATAAALYHDLDGGFTPLAWFFPYWVPFPSFLRRDRAHVELKKRFGRVIAMRRESGKVKAGRTDLMETFMTVPYKKVLDGRTMTDNEVAGLLIALLMAGQHTSSTVSSWLISFVCTVPGLLDKLYEEQKKAFEILPGPLSMEHLDHMPLLHACVRETLRLRPPIMCIMRRAREDFVVKAEGRTYAIPKGSQVCVSPTVNQRLPDEWDDPLTFDPYRFLKKEDGKYVVTMGEHLPKGGRFKWVPFGAGRHRCIGFEFAQLQIRCIVSTLIRNFDLRLASGKLPAINYRTMIHTPLDANVVYKKRPEAVV